MLNYQGFDTSLGTFFFHEKCEVPQNVKFSIATSVVKIGPVIMEKFETDFQHLSISLALCHSRTIWKPIQRLKSVFLKSSSPPEYRECQTEKWSEKSVSIDAGIWVENEKMEQFWGIFDILKYQCIKQNLSFCQCNFLVGIEDCCLRNWWEKGYQIRYYRKIRVWSLRPVKTIGTALICGLSKMWSRNQNHGNLSRSSSISLKFRLNAWKNKSSLWYWRNVSLKFEKDQIRKLFFWFFAFSRSWFKTDGKHRDNDFSVDCFWTGIMIDELRPVPTEKVICKNDINS